MLAAILGLGDDSFKSVLESIKYLHTVKCCSNSLFHLSSMHPGLPKQLWWASSAHPRGSLLVFSASQHWWSTCPAASAMPVQGEVASLAGGEQDEGALLAGHSSSKSPGRRRRRKRGGTATVLSPVTLGQCSTWTCRFSVLDSVEYISKLNTCLIFLSRSFNWVVLEWNCWRVRKKIVSSLFQLSFEHCHGLFHPPLKWCILSLREKCGTISQQPIHYFLLRFLPLPLSSSEARSFIAFNFSGNSTLQSLREGSSKAVTI